MPADKIRALDMRLIDELFGMGGGYVLDFSDRTFAEFFCDELEIDIDDPNFSVEGTSKAKRLRYFLRTSDSSTRVRVLKALWEYRCAQQRRKRIEEQIPDAQSEFDRLIARLGGLSVKPSNVFQAHLRIASLTDDRTTRVWPAILAIETNPILDSRLAAQYCGARVEGKGTRSQN